jgi:putative transposase
MIQLAQQLAVTIGTAPACEVLEVPRSSFYRAQLPPAPSLASSSAPVLPTPPRALRPAEKEQVREVLNSERFQDQAPREVYATLLDEATYLCHWRTMYRILDQYQEVRERRNQLRHPVYAKPELLATQPNELWSWDITKLRGPRPWSYYYLYVILDVYSRCVVGWLLTEHESEELAKQLIDETCVKHGILRGELNIHADNGSPMISKSVAQLMIDLGVTKSHSRPHVPDDNPYSEAQFKTMKYRPDYPDRFGCAADARAWAQAFFTWYNHEHHHTGLGLLTPASVHSGQAEAVLAKRQQTLQEAYVAHPERFVKGRPKPASLPEAVWINPPRPRVEGESAIQH